MNRASGLKDSGRWSVVSDSAVSGKAMSVKRSGDVTAAAVVLFCGSGLLLLFGVFAAIGAAAASVAPQQRGFELIGVFMMLFVYVGGAGWGIATGIGVLKLQPWARISMIVLSALGIVGCLLSTLGMFAMRSALRDNPQLPPNAVAIATISLVTVLAIPLAVAIWWLVLFTRRRVALEFATRGAGEASFTPIGGGLEQGSAIAGGAGVSASGRRAIPVSIRIIAVLYILGSAMLFLTVEYMREANMPTLLLGKLVEGRSAWMFLIVLAIVQLVICIAVLRRRAWALDGLITILVFGVLNCFGFTFSPSRGAFFARILSSKHLAPQVVVSQMMARFTHLFLPVSLIGGGMVTLVLLYFLVTRRRAFRDACTG